MLPKPKAQIQMKHQREKNPNKDKANQRVPNQQERNPLQDLYYSSSSSKPLLSKKPQSLLKCNKKTNSTMKPRIGLTNIGSRKTHLVVKNAALPKSNLKQVCGERNKSKNGQRLNLLPDLGSGCEKSEAELRCVKQGKVAGELINVKEIGIDLNVEGKDITPISKSFCGSSLNSAVFEDSNASSRSNSEVKTPPIEVSVSPEIQFGGEALLNSAATPSVCYGTGHFVSGVSDGRKCRSRGILTVGDALDYGLGSGKDGNEIDWDYSYGGKVNEKKGKESGALIPLPAEASVKWLLSPCDENCGSPEGDSSSKLRNLGIDEGSSPSVCIDSDSELVCDRSEDVIGISGKTCMVSPRRFSEFEGDFLSNGVVKKEKNGFRRSIIEEKSPLSIGSLSSGNVIQTPNSQCTSGGNKGKCWFNMSEHGTCTSKPEVDSEDQILGRARSILDPMSLSFQFTDLSSSACSVDLRRNFDNHVASVSVSSVENMSQSHMRISWRDLLASRSSDMDELDCCRCLSDEDIDGDELQKLGDDCGSRRENGKSTGSACKSPECTVHQTASPLQKKEIRSPYKLKSCAESISTDGGGLAASVDFD